MAENDSYKGGPFEGVERHASALGWVVLEWCRIYEELGLLFVELVNPDNRQALLAAWHAVKSDRTQRFMLRAVAENSLCGRRAPLRRRILWAIGQLDSMENKRNDAVHAPVAIGLDENMVRVAVFPMLTTGNPRAQALVGNDLEKHFRVYQRNTEAIRHYLESLRPFLRAGAPLDQLPRRPQLEGIVRTTAVP
jgi:hypothetical protein